MVLKLGLSAECIWTRAENHKTNIDLYREYLETYPDGKYAELARENTEWANIEVKNDPEMIKEYTRQYPDGKFTERASEILGIIHDSKHSYKLSENMYTYMRKLLVFMHHNIAQGKLVTSKEFPLHVHFSFPEQKHVASKDTEKISIHGSMSRHFESTLTYPDRPNMGEGFVKVDPSKFVERITKGYVEFNGTLLMDNKSISFNGKIADKGMIIDVSPGTQCMIDSIIYEYNGTWIHFGIAPYFRPD